ncbi:uncharacterized protein Eint_110570 [Encephalitozoon intestinalis ATCC 50506]|uniref:Uncharacterized protein n=1 Tax=Encephalitozoon intestinalis (strain ATCC 50506) TaxID=876142 RepID=E0SAD2_ENCIT|nr:uncharacterized protein Eint_110570 [Encephalitozoon intestinalis ATCC 50506]ADM12557.1 hypothetical protein Eint_110570 [Encephalitozoon intestinalis ATCC 50506]UTX46413.1 hypothetical protein GPK93_11g20200 [Encephalitozoon intestinalis]
MKAGKALVVLFEEGSKVLFKAITNTISDIMLRDRMSKTEAEMILDVTACANKNKMKDSFLRMHEANSKERGGSPYIQSKILAAYTVLSGTSPSFLEEFQSREKNPSGKEQKVLSTKNKRIQF